MTAGTDHILFELENVLPKSSYQFAEPISLKMYSGENWIICGDNGSGKTFLVKTIMSSYILSQGKINYDFRPNTSKRVSDNILYLTFHDQYSSQAGSLYQLRWNQGLLGELESEGVGLPKVKDVLDTTNIQHHDILQIMEEKFNINDLMERHIISLSSGEFRRFQIAQIILKNPRLLIIENPYIGLDEENRTLVADFIQAIIHDLPIQVILTVSRMPKDTQGFTHIIDVRNGLIEKKTLNSPTAPDQEKQELTDAQRRDMATDFQNIVAHDKKDRVLSETILKLNKVTISYGTRTILKDLDWEVKKGEKWSLQGKNGAGKSTVLSIICADNPQSYRCDVTLFGHRRGSGESIWDIKKHIGFVSPEIFRSYRKPLPVENIIASGLYDTIGLYRKTQEEDIAKIDTWLKIFQIESLRGRNYLNLSDGEQRLILLVRAFVKNPALLILDEPFHGMDAKNRLKAKEIIELYCKQPDKTLIIVSHYTEDFPSCITNNLTLIKNN